MTKTHRVAICGIWIEACSYSGHMTRRQDFTLLRGRELLERRYPFLLTGQPTAMADVEWLPLLHARALPGGPIERVTYEELEGELLALLRDCSPLDGVVLDVHGAMLVEGRTDVEAELAGRVRQAAGKEVVIAAVEDLHGNTTPAFVKEVDLITAFTTAPHEDETESRLRACEQLVHCLDHGGFPWRAWVRVPVLVTGERSSTRHGPAKALYRLASGFIGRDGVTDASIWMGYPWQDEARSAMTVVVSGDEPGATGLAARSLAEECWSKRASFEFDSPAASAEECINQALRSSKRPFLVSDTGDNPTAGGRGDSTYFLAQLLRFPELSQGHHTVALASVVDASTVTACMAVGTGRRVSVALAPPVPGEAPVQLDGEVGAIRPGDAIGGDEAVISVGGCHFVFTSRRKPFHLISDFTALGLNPVDVDLTVVKIGYLEPELHAIAAAHMLALTPGAVDQHLNRLTYRRVARPVYPLDQFASGPSFEPTLFGPRRGRNDMRAGRPAAALLPVVVAIDLGATSIKGALVDSVGRRLVELNAPTDRERGSEAVVDRLVTTVAGLLQQAGDANLEPAGIAVAVCGVVDAGRLSVTSVNLGWQGVRVEDSLSACTDLPVALVNDAEAGAYAEAQLGAARNHDDFLYVALGTGIGAAIVKGGQHVPGSHGHAGELGHLRISGGGPMCACGAVGCLETWMSAKALRARFLLASGMREALNPDEIVGLVAAGDPVATDIWDAAVDALAFGLLNASVLLDPGAIVIGGGISLAGAVLFDRLGERLLQKASSFQVLPELLPAALGTWSGCVGAALVAWKARMQAPTEPLAVAPQGTALDLG